MAPSSPRPCGLLTSSPLTYIVEDLAAIDQRRPQGERVPHSGGLGGVGHGDVGHEVRDPVRSGAGGDGRYLDRRGVAGVGRRRDDRLGHRRAGGCRRRGHRGSVGGDVADLDVVDDVAVEAPVPGRRHAGEDCRQGGVESPAPLPGARRGDRRVGGRFFDELRWFTVPVTQPISGDWPQTGNRPGAPTARTTPGRCPGARTPTARRSIPRRPQWPPASSSRCGRRPRQRRPSPTSRRGAGRGR